MDNLISNILKGKKFSYISIPFWEYEKCRKQVHNLLIGCIYPYRIEYQLMRLANALSHKHKNEQDVEEETCPLRKCLYEFDSIERCKSRCISFQDEDFKNNMFKNIEKREQVKSDFNEDEKVDEDTLNNQLIELLKIASVYITESVSDYPEHIKKMYENREKVFTYDEYLEMYTECLEEYNDKKFEEKFKLKLTLGYEDYLYVYQTILNELKNKILQINGDIGVLRQYISFLHEDKDEELDKQTSIAGKTLLVLQEINSNLKPAQISSSGIINSKAGSGTGINRVYDTSLTNGNLRSSVSNNISGGAGGNPINV
jgi:hypothetical protein